MKIEPLSKDIFERATALGIDSIRLEFSGGSDEAYFNVQFEPDFAVKLAPGGEDWRLKTFYCADYGKLEADIEDWMRETYDYSGAGDGGDYGDTIVYDLKNRVATTQEWYEVRQEGSIETEPLPLE